MNFMKTLAAAALLVGLTVNVAMATATSAQIGNAGITITVADSGQLDMLISNIDLRKTVLVSGVQQATELCVGGTPATCQTACIANYPSDYIGNTPMLTFLKNGIPFAKTHNISGTPLANLRVCCKANNNNTECLNAMGRPL